MGKKEKAAKLVRGITVPPVLAIGLIIILASWKQEVFRSIWEVWEAIVLLGVVPVLAYPLQKVLPGYRDKGREGQRNLAFVLNLTGYAVAVSLGYLQSVTTDLQLIFNTYLISVLILTVLNRGFHVRASGHACSATGPLVFLMYYFGWGAFIPCLLNGAGIVWSSLLLKRHTAKELLFGMFTCLAAFVCAFGIALL